MALILTNSEGSAYNPAIDNYLVASVVNYADTAFGELDGLLKLIERSHEEFVMVECDAMGLEIFKFLKDISKIVIHGISKLGNGFYIKVQKNLLSQLADSF